MNTNNGVKWRRFIVPKKLNKLMTMHLFIDTYKSNNIHIGVTVNRSTRRHYKVLRLQVISYFRER